MSDSNFPTQPAPGPHQGGYYVTREELRELDGRVLALAKDVHTLQITATKIEGRLEQFGAGISNIQRGISTVNDTVLRIAVTAGTLGLAYLIVRQAGFL